MTFLRALWITEASAMLLLLFCAAAIAALFAMSAAPSDTFSPRQAAVIGFTYTVSIGAIPALLLAAPFYAFLRSRERHRLWVAIAMGLVPAAGISFFDFSLALYAVVVSLVVSIGTHILVARARP